MYVAVFDQRWLGELGLGKYDGVDRSLADNSDLLHVSRKLGASSPVRSPTLMASRYIVYFSVGMRAVVVDKRDLKGQRALAAPKEDSLSLHTLSTSPIAETLATGTHPSTRGATRPPSYFSSGAASFDSYDVKKD